MGKALADIHLPRRRGPAESVLDDGIKYFCTHKDEKCGVMYESNYFHLPISEDRSEGIKVAGRPTIQSAKRRE